MVIKVQGVAPVRSSREWIVRLQCQGQQSQRDWGKMDGHMKLCCDKDGMLKTELRDREQTIIS